MSRSTLKTSLTLALSIAGASLLVASGIQADASWYVKSSILEADVSGTSFNSTGRSANVEFDQDTAFSAALGYKTEGNSLGALRFEAEYVSTENDTDTVNFNALPQFSGSNVNGSLETETIFFNAIQEFNTGSLATPYVGIGIGYSDIESTISYGPVANITDSDNSIAYQGLVGLDVKFSPSFSGFVEYRYVDLGEVDLVRDGGGPGGRALTVQNGDIDFDALAIGIAYTF